MIGSFIVLILCLFIIILLGYMALASFKGLSETIELPLLLSLSWLSGCLVVAISSLISLFLSFAGISMNPAIIIAMPTVILVFFNNTIFENTQNVLSSMIESLKEFEVKKLNYLWIFGFLVIAIFSIQIFILNAVKPVWAWDAWMIWSFKSKLLFFDLFNLDLFKNKTYSYAHLDYPLLVPFVQAFIAKTLGFFNPRFTQVFFSLSFISYITILYYFVKRFVEGPLSIFIVMPLICTPVLVLNFTGAYVDGIVSLYHLLAVSFLFIYLSKPEAEAKYLVPVAVGLSGMLMTKNEGSLYTITLFIIAIATAFIFTNKFKLHLKNLAITFAVAFMFHLPWVIFTKSMGLKNRFIPDGPINISYCFDQLQEIPKIIDYLIFSNMLKFEFWGILFYIAIAMLVIGLIRRYYLESFFFIGALMLNLAGIVITYVISPHDLMSHMVSSFDRVVLSLSPLVLCYIISILPLKPNNYLFNPPIE